MQPNGRKRRLQGEINVVPYIDVMLVLLIIFMVTAPMLTQGVKVDLPKADAKPIDDQTREPLVVSMDRAGSLYVNVGGSPGTPLDRAEVARRVRVVLERDAKTPILIKADQSVPYGKVVKVLTLLDGAGAEKIGFVTDPDGSAPHAPGH